MQRLGPVLGIDQVGAHGIPASGQIGLLLGERDLYLPRAACHGGGQAVPVEGWWGRGHRSEVACVEGCRRPALTFVLLVFGDFLFVLFLFLCCLMLCFVLFCFVVLLACLLVCLLGCLFVCWFVCLFVSFGFV